MGGGSVVCVDGGRYNKAAADGVTHGMDFIELAGAVIGIAYILLEYKANPWMWLCGVLMPAAYIYIYFKNGLFANASFNIYNVGISVYGLWQWLRRPREVASGGDSAVEGLPIRSLPRRLLPVLLLTAAVLTAALTLLLSRLHESQVPFLDGLSTALSMVGMWMLAKKYYQQWLCWIVVEPIVVAMCLSTGLWATAVLYTVYEVVAVKGYLHWKRQVGAGREAE